MFPRSLSSVASIPDSTAIARSPSNQFYAVLSKSSVTILDASDPSHSIASSFPTATQTIYHWILWCDDSSIFFGNKTGQFYSMTFENRRLRCSPIQNLNAVVTDGFSAPNSQIGLCLAGPKIIFVDRTGKTVDSLTFGKQPGIIRNVSDTGRLVFQIGNAWFTYERTQKKLTQIAIPQISFAVASAVRVIACGTDGTV
jgi:hypothetical protein